ncbi:neuraminidase-like domain-containing protein [Pseudomonas sp. MWU13-3659]|uniref:Tc toxin subunit A-related protein n=1 Tax=Pseudomonas sp. MWU13-3659 TaxID=2986964 RepID=UPI0020756A36|nr:neuraminidase-like domain-containing protein [Pseudomonas sp. MWU13-3659]
MLTQEKALEAGSTLLEQRRPDIGELLLDPTLLEQPISALTIAIRVLTRLAQKHIVPDAHLPEALASTGQHAYLPFHHAQEQIKTVLKHRKIPLFDLLQKSDPSYPNFCNDRLRTPELREAMRKASGFSPALQALLLAQKPLRRTADGWRAWYGFTSPAKAAIDELLDVENYCRRTGLTTEQVLEMLAISGIDDNASTGFSAVQRSNAYQPATALALEQYHPGAAYINTRRETPLTVKDVLDKPGITLSFDRLDYNCLPRMYQMIHLQRELALPFAEVDLLLISILRAQGLTTNWNMTPCTLRALGVFRYLNEVYGVSAEQFSALVLEVSPYSVGDRPSMLDRVLDGPGANTIDKVENRLVLDDRTFDPTDGADGQYKILPGLCNAVGLDEPTTLAYIGQAKKALGLSSLTLSLELLSSLYRLSRLHRLLKRPLHEGIALVALLGASGETLLTQLAGKPVISNVHAPDVLDMLVALVNLDQWLREERILPSTLLDALTPASGQSLSLTKRLSSAITDRQATISDKPGEVAPAADTPLSDSMKELMASVLLSVFGAGNNSLSLTPQHIPHLLRWCDISENELLAAIRKVSAQETPSEADNSLWRKLEQRCKLVECLRLSPGVLEAFLDHKAWFDLEEVLVPSDVEALTDWLPGAKVLVARSFINLDLCYQLSRFRAWIDVCKHNDGDEKAALDYLSSHLHGTESAEVDSASAQLAKLLGWEAEAVKLATPRKKETTSTGIALPTFNDFLTTLTPDETAYYDTKTTKIQFIVRMATNRYIGYQIYSDLTQDIIDKLDDFIRNNPEPLLLTQDQYKEAYRPDLWEKARIKEESDPYTAYLPIALEALPDNYGTKVFFEWKPRVPTTITDIDRILRLRALCKRTGLPCQSLLDLVSLDNHHAYTKFEATSQLLLASCDDAVRDSIEKHMQERWRDALAGYLLAHWAPSQPGLQNSITSFDDLSNYFLTDIGVSSQVDTTLLDQAIGSLQHYLFRLYARLEPGLDETPESQQAEADWRNYLGQYATWKQRQDQLNHPENLIHYSKRPNKSDAFRELEVELNQGKLDTAVLDTAIRTYLTKFERVSNLQVISGYLDGRDPLKDTYHLIGKTNTSPPEYYWRTLDMGLRDDQQRLSPLAWSQWEKIGLAVSSEVVQSEYKSGGATLTRDVIRPVVIGDRRYVFWVERGATDLTSGETPNKTLPKTRKIAVNYAYQQSDDTWSTANELICLDGYKDAVWLGDTNNPCLKSLNYKPELIIVVDKEGIRNEDPWLIAVLHDLQGDTVERTNQADGALESEKHNNRYFIEARDLLLLDSKPISSLHAKGICKTLISTFNSPEKIQHVYTGHSTYLRLQNTGKEATKGNALETEELTITAKALSIADEKIELTIKTTNTNLNLKQATTTILAPSSISAGDISESEAKYIICYPENNPGNQAITIRHSNLSAPITILIDFPELDAPWNVSIKRSENLSQYLEFDVTRISSLAYTPQNIRLNTLFGKRLVAYATKGIEHVLTWETQCLTEPKLPSALEDAKLELHGANGLHLRELFLHLPALIATRLTEQQQFDEAEDWYRRYLFSPFQPTADEDGRPVPWRTRPLSEVGTLCSTLQKDVDLHSHVFVRSRYYQQAVYLSLLENWLLQGDHLYRQLKPSTLNHAWSCYQKVLKVLGPLPELSKASRWKPIPLGKVEDSAFRKPLNPRVIQLRNTLESRLYNLRHGLTLDGKRLPPMDWNSESTPAFTPNSGGVSDLPIAYQSAPPAFPHYRFRQLLPVARAAAQQLLDFGRHYLHLLQTEDAADEDLQLKEQEINIADFEIRIREEAIKSLEASKKSLDISRSAATAEHAYLSRLIDVGRSAEEEGATLLRFAANSMTLLSIPFDFAAGLTEAAVPTIYGVAFGGNKPSSIGNKAALALRVGAEGTRMLSEELMLQGEYNRRADEWAFERQQVDWDLKLINQDMAITDIELKAASYSLEQAKQIKADLETIKEGMTTGFLAPTCYHWLTARQGVLYRAAYDAVLSLCLDAENAWRFEMGDYTSDRFVNPAAWRDNYKGLLAGESLVNDLQRLENQYMLANERRLTIKKSFSLKKHLGKQWAKTFKTEPDRTTSLVQALKFKADDFDQSYPGHYHRQLKHVSVTLMINKDKQVDELCAILTQTRSTTLLMPDENAARSFYPGNETKREVIEAHKNTELVLHNPRQNQQIALSSTVAEDGLGYEPGTWVYELMFHDGRYLPFEGTGAISEWTLEILGDDKLLKDLSIIEDIKFNMVYTAKAGDPAFTQAIRTLRTEPLTASKTNKDGAAPLGDLHGMDKLT